MNQNNLACHVLGDRYKENDALLYMALVVVIENE